MGIVSIARRNRALRVVLALTLLVTLAIASVWVWRRYQNFSTSRQEVSVPLSELERSSRQAQMTIETELSKASWTFTSGMNRGRCDPAWRKVFYVNGRIDVTSMANNSSVRQMRMDIVRDLEALGYVREAVLTGRAVTAGDSLDSGVVRISIITQPEFGVLISSRCTAKLS